MKITVKKVHELSKAFNLIEEINSLNEQQINIYLTKISSETKKEEIKNLMK